MVQKLQDKFLQSELQFIESIKKLIHKNKRFAGNICDVE